LDAIASSQPVQVTDAIEQCVQHANSRHLDYHVIHLFAIIIAVSLELKPRQAPHAYFEQLCQSSVDTP
jgi:hypothetical protein